MSTGSLKNQSNLIQSPPARPTLEQMRAKLASAPKIQASQNRIKKHPSKKSVGQVWIGVLIVCGLLGSANFIFFIQKGNLFDQLGLQTVLLPLRPPANLSDADLVRFWAYASYDVSRLQSRYAIQENALIDTDDAKQHLNGLLKKLKDKQLNHEIQALIKAKGPVVQSIRLKAKK